MTTEALAGILSVAFVLLLFAYSFWNAARHKKANDDIYERELKKRKK